MVPMTLTREHPDPAREKERTPLAYELAMKLEAMATAAHVLTNQADELKDELAVSPASGASCRPRGPVSPRRRISRPGRSGIRVLRRLRRPWRNIRSC